VSDWLHQSSWSAAAIHVAGQLVALNHLHFLETRSPLFWIRALHIGRHLSPDDQRLAWAQGCLVDALAQLDALNHRSLGKGEHWASTIVDALGFEMRPNYNPFREHHDILQRDAIFAALLQQKTEGKALTGEDGAFATVARARGLTERKVREIYYKVRNRIKQVSTK
jgi:hypothetical protein